MGGRWEQSERCCVHWLLGTGYLVFGLARSIYLFASFRFALGLSGSHCCVAAFLLVVFFCLSVPRALIRPAASMLRHTTILTHSPLASPQRCLSLSLSPVCCTLIYDT